jgi:hypothetical protein
MTINKIKLFLSVFVLFVIVFPLQRVFALTITPIRIEIAGDPGQVLTREMSLINDKDTNETYYVSYLNFEAQGETGNPAFVEPKDDLGTWMTAPESVILAPKESKTVSIKITIPKNAEPGGHFAAIFWGTVPRTSNTNSVSIGAKINGQVNENGGIIEFGTLNKQTFFTALPVSFYYRFQNLGGDRVKPQGEVKMKDILWITEKSIPGNPVDGNILPNSIRKFETVWQGKDGPTPREEKDQGNFFTKVGYEWRNFAFGYYRAKLSLAYGTNDEVSNATFSFWVFPWHLLIVITIFLLIIFFVGRKLLIIYHRRVVEQAKKMLKEEQERANRV